MRIVGGRFRRRSLSGPTGRMRVRPTTDAVREALFNALAARHPIAGARVLDLFAGTGALALEAISRGAAHATLVDADRAALRLARQNADALGVADRCRFVRADAVGWLGRGDGGAFDLAFADPPYGHDAAAALPGLVRPRLAAGGLFVLEHDARQRLGGAPAGLVFERAYGTSAVRIFEGPPPPDPPAPDA